MHAGWSCATCARPNHDDAAFCGGCGAARPPASAFCIACGFQLEPAQTFCTSCGQQVPAAAGAPAIPAGHASEQTLIAASAPSAAMPPPESSASPTSGGLSPRHRGAAIAIAAVTAGIAVAAGAGALLTRGSSDSSSKAQAQTAATTPAAVTTAAAIAATTAVTPAAVEPAPASQQLPPVLAPVAAAQASLELALRTAAVTSDGLTAIRQRAQALSAAATTAQAEIAALQLPVADAQLAGQVTAALSDQREYADEIAATPVSPLKVPDGSMASLAAAAQRASADYAGLGVALPNPAMVVTPALFDRLASRIAALKGADTDLRSFVARIARLLETSSAGRSEIRSTVARTAACHLAPADAGSRIDAVAANRQSVLGQLAAIDTPTTATERIADALRTAMSHSAAADRHFANWVRNEAGWYYTAPVGCRGGTLPFDSEHDAAMAESARANTAKARFTSLYNPLARRFHHRTWQASSI